MTKDSKAPLAESVVNEGDAEAFIPYPEIGEDLGDIPIYARPQLHYYIARMGFLPNALKLYLHIPWVAKPLFELNDAVMRDERGGLSEHFKYRLALIASRDNECTYCTAHHVATLKRRWRYEDDQLKVVLGLDQPDDEREAVAFEFVHQASLDPAGVSDELRSRLVDHFTPQEIMEIALVVGFWKMYNTIHTAMDVPLEETVGGFSGWVGVEAKR